MSIITLIRHGQANSAATNEADYDRLSDLGIQQAIWLGDHLRSLSIECDAAFTGSLQRQKDTFRHLGLNKQATIDERLNEIAYYDLVDCMKNQFGLTPPDGIGFIQHFQTTFAKWEAGEITNPPETWQNYRDRVGSVLDTLRHAGANVVVVTSGGIVAMAIAHALGLSREALVKALIEGVNTGVTQLHYIGGSFHLKQYNAVPHLERTDRLYARTYY